MLNFEEGSKLSSQAALMAKCSSSLSNLKGNFILSPILMINFGISAMGLSALEIRILLAHSDRGPKYRVNICLRNAVKL